MAFSIGSNGLVGRGGQALVAGEDPGPGGLENAVAAAQQDQGQDDPPVLGALVVAAQQVGDGPDQPRVVVGRCVAGDGSGLGQPASPAFVTVSPTLQRSS